MLPDLFAFKIFCRMEIIVLKVKIFRSDRDLMLFFAVYFLSLSKPKHRVSSISLLIDQYTRTAHRCSLPLKSGCTQRLAQRRHPVRFVSRQRLRR